MLLALVTTRGSGSPEIMTASSTMRPQFPQTQEVGTGAKGEGLSHSPSQLYSVRAKKWHSPSGSLQPTYGSGLIPNVPSVSLNSGTYRQLPKETMGSDVPADDVITTWLGSHCGQHLQCPDAKTVSAMSSLYNSWNWSCSLFRNN